MILNHKTLNHGEILIWHFLSMLTTFDDFGFSISSFKRDSQYLLGNAKEQTAILPSHNFHSLGSSYRMLPLPLSD